MKKMSKKIIALILTLAVLTSFSVIPITKISAVAPEGETYEDYDVITYSSLMKNGAALGTQTTLSGANVFTYNRTSPTGSAILKYRWQVGTLPKFQLSFEKTSSTAMDYMFGVQIDSVSDLDEASAANFPNGRVWLRPGIGQQIGFEKALKTGSIHDVEFARLKVKDGSNKGKYYVYLKIDGVLISDSYVNSNVVDSDLNYISGPGNTSCSMKSNEIFLVAWGSSNTVISETPPPDEFAPYDEIYYSNLLKNGRKITDASTGIGGGNTFTYNATSPTYSAILKFRWTAGTNTGIQFSFDKAGSGMTYPFGVWVKTTEQAAPNGAWHLKPTQSDLMVNMDEAVSQGDTFDIELGRLKVVAGDTSHIGKYYVYLKVNGVLMGETYNEVNSDGSYMSSSNTCHLSNEILFADWSNYGNSISESPYTEEYEEYDNVEYRDLKDASGNDLNVMSTALSGSSANIFKYNQTSPTGSVKLRYSWKIGSLVKFQLSFERSNTSMEYLFGAWLEVPETGYSNGSMWVSPGNGTKLNLTTPFVSGSEHNVEYGRLKVATGPNKGKYYLYIKIDDVLISDTYINGSLINNQLVYTSEPNSATCDMKSGEILLAFWGSNGNEIGNYKEIINGHEYTRCDFDRSGSFNAKDIIGLVSYLIGGMDKTKYPEYIADFNNDKLSDIIDLVVMKRHFASDNSYTRQGNFKLGTQEHTLEDSTKTATYIADASAALGANAYRLSIDLYSLFSPTSTNDVTIKTTAMNKLKSQVAALKEKGITNILYVTDGFALPYNYGVKGKFHYITVPDPTEEPVNYQNWLKVNANAFKRLAQEVPEIKTFEPFNEINLTGTRFEKYGISFDATPEQQVPYKFTVEEKAYIIADLCWNASNAVKSVNPENQVTTPSIAVQDVSTVETAFIGELYKAINSGAHPSNQTVGDIRVDNYFTILNIHTYPSYSAVDSEQDNYVSILTGQISDAYNTIVEYGDGNSPVWLTETGASSYNPDTTARNEESCAAILSKILNRLSTSDYSFLDAVFLYKLADVSTSLNLSATETGYGLFYSGDNRTKPYAYKPTAKVVYSFLHNGSTNYSALNSLVSKYS